MPVSTIDSHVRAALQLRADRDTMYVAIGQTSDWQDEENPPTEDETTSTLNEVIGYKKVSTCVLCRPLGDGETTSYATFDMPDGTWVEIPDSDAYTEQARHIFIESEILSSDLPLGEYRQVGVHVDLTANSGINKNNLEPSEVSDEGVLLFYENKLSQRRIENTTVKEGFIVEV